jgi:CheY-like chemotaxis protein
MCRHRILIADDETDIRDILRRLLLSEGFCVCEAGNGLEALAAAQQCDVDLIMIDITMPRMSGTEAVRQLRANPRFADTPIMIMTGNAINAPASYSQIGGITLFPKPLNLNQVLAAIRQAVQESSRYAAR